MLFTHAPPVSGHREPGTTPPVVPHDLPDEGVAADAEREDADDEGGERDPEVGSVERFRRDGRRGHATHRSDGPTPHPAAMRATDETAPMDSPVESGRNGRMRVVPRVRGRSLVGTRIRARVVPLGGEMCHNSMTRRGMEWA
ncbi:hypothetical protein GCM10022282_15420 [Agromyces indicus]